MTTDEFEATEMHDGARIVHRDKRIVRWMTGVLSLSGLSMIALAIIIAVINPSSPKPMPLGAEVLSLGLTSLLGVALMLLGIAFGVFRTLVTERAVHIKYGLWGPTIPLGAIRSCRVTTYDWKKYGGWGLRKGRDGSWAYVPGQGKVVEIVYDDLGSERRVLVGPQNPEALAAEIDRARAMSEERAALTRQPLPRVAPEPRRGATEEVEEDVEDERDASSRTMRS